jgi:hypothetical protein
MAVSSNAGAAARSSNEVTPAYQPRRMERGGRSSSGTII